MISKGTTPTFTFTGPEGLDMTEATQIWVTFSTPDEREIVTKTGDSVRAENNKVYVYLEQQESLRLTKETKAQINWVYLEEGKEKRSASNKMLINTETNLKSEVLNAE